MIAEAERRKPGRPKAELVTMADDLRAAMLAMLSTARAVSFPSPKYRDNPLLFFREVLGVEPWSRQAELIEAVRDHDRVACKAGRRVSKSHTVAGIALWWYCSWPGARVVLSSTTARQVDQILWRELSMMKANAGRCVACLDEMDRLERGGMTRIQVEQRIPRPCPHSAVIDGDLAMIARTGLRSEDFREVKGFTARQAEAMQGIAGSHLLFIIDEASGVPQPIFDAISGNRAGGGKVLLFGNPTQNAGEFFDAFHSKNNASKSNEGHGYYCLTVSSEESPNVREGRLVIPGLATREYIREREIEWGRDSAQFKIHVLGEFALAEEGRIFSVHVLKEAEERHLLDAPEDSDGRLYIGLDPAGESGSGDESAFCGRRKNRVLKLVTRRGLTDEAHLAELLALIAELKLPREKPVVVLDREGSVGSSLYGRIRNYLETRDDFDFVAVRASDRATRNPLVYDRMRDELCANLQGWFRDGGSIPEDVKLSRELHELEWYVSAHNGRRKLKPKDAIRKALGRSPDRYDALSLSCWEPLALRVEAMEEREDRRPSAPRGARAYSDDERVPTLDPFAGADAWRGDE